MLARLSLGAGKRRFQDLSEQEVLALAISSEEEDGRIYAAYAAKLRAEYPASAAVFDGMAAEEDEHRRRLIELYQQRFGDIIVPLRREHVADFYTRRPVWLVENLGLDRIRQEAADMEREAREFYVAAAGRSTDAETRKLLGDLAAAEAGHQATAGKLVEQHLDPDARQVEDLAVASTVHPHLDTARPCRPDGRLGLDPGADLRHRFRHAKPVDDVSRRPLGVCRRRHLDGLYGSRP